MGIMEWVAISISFIAVIVAFWQGFLAKTQLEQAKTTKTETEKVLDEIKSKVAKIEMISDETRKDVKEQISKLIDKQDENFKVLLNAPKENSQNEMIMSVLPKLMENPEMLQALIKLGNQTK
jgi:gas vesicle protein